jgi:hypothetical protein
VTAGEVGVSEAGEGEEVAMRTDTKALVWVIGMSTALAVLVMGILAAAAFSAVPRDMAINLALGCIVCGGIMIGLIFSRGLRTRGTLRNEDR